MGFRVRKSFKVIPGVRMTVSTRGISTSVGTKGYRVTRSSSGRVTRTMSIPGTGVAHTKTVGASRSSQPSTGRRQSAPTAGHNAAPAPATTGPAKPGFTAPRWEKDVYAATVGGEAFRLPQLVSAYPAEAPLIATLDGLSALAAGQRPAALNALQWSWGANLPIENHPFVRKYLQGATVTVEIATGVTAVMPLCRDVVGLTLAELLQEAGQVPAAIQVVESLEPSAIAAVSLAELYLEANRPADVVQLTNGLANEDDPTALLLTFRGTALSQVGQPGAAREALKAALAPRSRSAEIRHLALLARASTYVAEGKKALAKKDLERVLAEDANFPGLDQALAQLDVT